MSRENSEEIARRLLSLMGGPAHTPQPLQPTSPRAPAAPAPRSPSGPNNGSELSGFTLLQEMKCDSDLPARIEDLENGRYVGEVKEDGHRFKLYCGVSPYVRPSYNASAFLSRRPSDLDGLLQDRSAEYPQITGCDWDAKGLKGTVFDGELHPSSGKYVAFDLPIYKGLDMRQLPYIERRKLLEHVITNVVREPTIQLIERRTSGLFAWFQELVMVHGLEGLVIKDLYGTYGQGWAKMKKCYDVSTVITGKRPSSRHAGTGSLNLSVYHEGRLVEIGAVKWGERTEADYDRLIGKVLDVYIQEVHAPTSASPCGRFRHASPAKDTRGVVRLRSDVDPRTVTYEKLKADLRKPPSYMR
jgi:hypothetical protein